MEVCGMLGSLARNNEVRTALSAAGMVSGDFNFLVAEICTVQEVAQGAASAAGVGHRPAGTAEAVASMVTEGRCAAQTPDAQALQLQLDAFKAEAEVL